MDDRIKKNINTGARASRNTVDSERSSDKNALVSNRERNRRFAAEFTQQVLPNVNLGPEWHLCWLSTTNAYDTIQNRMRLGYIAVKPEEIEGFDELKVKEGEHSGFISCKEMLLFKMPMERYQDYMAEVHHYQPLENADSIRIQQEQLVNSMKDSSGRSVVRTEGDGLNETEFSAPIFE